MLPDRRLQSGTWDKHRYAAGESARLTVSGLHLGAGPLLLVVEAEVAPGRFSEVARAHAEVAPGEASAGADFAFPAPQPVQAAGQLVGGRFTPARFEPGAALELEVEAAGLAGQHATLEVEREQPGGSWERVAILEVVLDERGARAQLPVAAAPLPPPAPASCAFASLDGASAWMTARAPLLEGSTLQFLLEREAAPGLFVEVGQAVGTVHAGEARASLPLPRSTGP